MNQKLLCLSTVIVLALLVAAAPAGAARLDRSFGHDGKVVDVLGSWDPLAEKGPPLHLARIQGGGFFALAGSALVARRPNGQLRRGFGTNGRLQVEAPGGTALDLTGLALDSRGRILVAGTTKEDGSRASAFVARYLRHGRLDRSFGTDGIVVTALGLPTPPPNKGISPTPVSTGPVVRVLGLEVDAGDRPLLTGSWLSDYQSCYPSITDTPKETGYVARLTVDGSIDPSFGGDGVVVPDPAMEAVTSPSAAGNGILSTGTLVSCRRGGPFEPELTRVGKSGETDQRFGSGGLVDLPFWTLPAMARDRFGRILLLGPTGADERWILQRLSPAGKLDLRFGHQGETRLQDDSGFETLATDHRGRAILAGHDSQVLLVERRRSDGSVDHSFGRHGEIDAVFPKELELSNPQIVVGGGKILVGGTWVKGDRYGVAFVRYHGD